MRTLVILVVLCVSCSWFKSEARHAGATAISCTTDKAKAALAEFGPTVETVVRNAIDSAGKVDRASVKASAAGFAADVGGCVLRDVFARLGSMRSPLPGAPQSEPQAVDLDDAAAAWEELRREQFAGASYQ